MTIISYLYCVLLFIVAGVGLSRYKLLTIPFKILTWSVVAVSILGVLSKFFSVKYRNNAPILQVQSIAEFVFYLVIYYYLFKNKTIKKAILVSIVVITIFFFINTIFLQPFAKKFPTNVYVPTQTLYAVFSLLLFKEMLMYPIKINIIKQSVFWFNTAILFYATTMFFNLGLSNYLAEHTHYDIIITFFWYLIIYSFHVLICVALLTDNKKITAPYA
ncbi:hypothetical protein [Mucilaginibacter gotjawali]|uniref:YhhN-like protein n=1 Tax=Mucilaginibacter gotjawali TaxID=1550579 RepID=A0A839SD95_9SPHI|nr:hypothetical protein [Mucilaginibacter gotjawali]MBB3054850.1 hypothetical protein [Mucilaginibacter gotjawali]